MSLSAIFDPLVRAWFEENGSGSGGGSEEWIGDGNTHIWISLPEDRTSPMLGVCPNGTVTVDWGDGTAPDVLTGTSDTAVKWTPTHNYAKAGDYRITLTADGEVALRGSGSNMKSGSNILRHSTGASAPNYLYTSAIRKIECGRSVTKISVSAFASCSNLRHVKLHEAIEEIGASAFANCFDILCIRIPDGVSSLSDYAFTNCYNLMSAEIPSAVMHIGAYAFNGCQNVSCYDFLAHTSVPALSDISAFTGMLPDCEIRVPAALAEEWKAATNWATYAEHIVGV